MPRPGVRRVSVSVKLAPDEKAKLEAAAHAAGKNLSDFLRDVLAPPPPAHVIKDWSDEQLLEEWKLGEAEQDLAKERTAAAPATIESLWSDVLHDRLENEMNVRGLRP